MAPGEVWLFFHDFGVVIVDVVIRKVYLVNEILGNCNEEGETAEGADDARRLAVLCRAQVLPHRHSLFRAQLVLQGKPFPPYILTLPVKHLLFMAIAIVLSFSLHNEFASGHAFIILRHVLN